MTASGAQMQRRAVSEHASPVEDLRINIGCGTAVAEGWWNVDNSPTIVLSRLKIGKRLLGVPDWPSNVHRHDVLKGLPFADGTVSCIYSSHTFEHFTFEQSLSLARECWRVLRPGGVLRIAVPDLELIIRDYQRDSDPLASHKFVERLELLHNWRDALHPGNHHSQMFDSRSLTELLRRAGFPAPKKCAFAESQIPDILGVELESRRRESLYVEGEK